MFSFRLKDRTESLRNRFFSYLLLIRDKYYKYKHVLRLWKKRFELTAFGVSILAIALEFTKKWITNFDNVLPLEGIRVCIEVTLLVYFSLLGVSRRINSRLFDRMSTFYKTLEKLKNSNIDEKGAHKGYKIKLINPEDLNAISTLSIYANGKEQFYSPTKYSLFTRWYQANPKIFSLILDEDDPIGYICVLPLKNERHFKYVIDKVNIEKKDIEPHDNCSNSIYIEAIFLKKRYQADKKLVNLVFCDLLDKIATFAKRDCTTIYGMPYYVSFKRFFSQNGFGEGEKQYGKFRTRCLFIKDARKLNENDNEYADYLKQYQFNDERARFFSNKLSSLANEKHAPVSKSIVDQITEMRPYVSDLTTFFDNSFADLEKSRIHHSFVGKTFRFFTHSVYSDEKKMVRDHSIGLTYIRFDKAHKNFVSCKFYTGTKKKNREYIYNGVCFFSTSEKKDILMVLRPELVLTDKRTLTEDLGDIGDSPTIITGRILKDNQDEIIPGEQGKRLLSLNLTTFSQHTKNTVSKIGVLYMDEGAHSIPDPDFLFQQFESVENDDDPVIKAIKLYLMRSNKVIIKGINHNIINNKEDIDKWLRKSYGALQNKTGIDYELYYLKNRDHVAIGGAYLNFLENGVARLTRTYKYDYIGGTTQRREQYMGEVNIRYSETDKRYLYIKLIKMESETIDDETESLYQHYRELFLILFWPEEKMDFEFTRGIIMGDRDVDRPGDWVVGGNICTLCKPNAYWNKHMNEDAEAVAHFPVFNAKKLEKVEKDFFTKVIQESVKVQVLSATKQIQDAFEKQININDDNKTTNTDKAGHAVLSADVEKIICKIASITEMQFDAHMCSYRRIFENSI